VQRGKFYNQFLNHTMRGPDDSGGQSNWIPTTLTEAYAAVLALPRLSYFNPNVIFPG
jgi:hypothetical protein